MSNSSAVYRFDSNTGTWTEDFIDADESGFQHRPASKNLPIPKIGRLSEAIFQDWPFDETATIPMSFWSDWRELSITSDGQGVIWLWNSGELYNNSSGNFHDVLSLPNNDWATEISDLEKSDVLGFGIEVVFYEYGKEPVRLQRIVKNIQWPSGNIYFTVDKQKNTWVYLPESGLVTIERDTPQFLGRIPDFWAGMKTGGVLPLADGRVWVGGEGRIWEYDDGNWTHFSIPGADQLITHFSADGQGTIYGATREGVYKFVDGKYIDTTWVEQWAKPMVYLPDMKDNGCPFYRRFEAIEKECYRPYYDPSYSIIYPEYDYKVRYLGVQDDGSVIYISNRLVAKLEDGRWKSFLFDTFTIDSATVDTQGNIWIFSSSDGLLRLSPDIFDDYIGIAAP